MRRPSRSGLLGLLLVVVAGALLAQAPGGDAPGPSSERLEALRREIEELEGRLQNLSATSSSLEAQLGRLGLEIQLQERKVAEAGAAVEQTSKQIQAAEGRIGELEGQLQERRKSLSSRLRGLYQMGRSGPLRWIFAAQAGADPLPAVRLVRYLARRDGKAVERYQQTANELGAERDRLAAQRDQLSSWQQQERLRRDKLASLSNEQRQMLATTDRERRNLAQRAADLAGEATRLGSLVADLAESATPLAGTPIENFRGALAWPVEGTVVEHFGVQLDPRYGTQVPHNGVALAVAKGAAVRAVYPGKVVYAAPFEGLGPTVILLHPGRMFSLYAGFSRLTAAKGKMVTLGQTLGTATERVYFEIRAENRPIDPEGWFR
ncbi:MAG TPA: peptidoglycan DD-metalloendopeptidase family protein [Thermoanaerobaculia bacterium]|nr:peptidoglycan DD-metalloendopeptidase family protein [Thermoanaerobaculia bacterium]